MYCYYGSEFYLCEIRIWVPSFTLWYLVLYDNCWLARYNVDLLYIPAQQVYGVVLWLCCLCHLYLILLSHFVFIISLANLVDVVLRSSTGHHHAYVYSVWTLHMFFWFELCICLFSLNSAWLEVIISSVFFNFFFAVTWYILSLYLKMWFNNGDFVLLGCIGTPPS